MTDRPRFTYRESVFARPPGYDEADDIAVTAEMNAIAARFTSRFREDGVHTDECRDWRYMNPGEACICAGGAVFVHDYDADAVEHEPTDTYWAGVQGGWW